MNKIILSLVCLLAVACNNINAQCTPNLTGPSGHISPDTTGNLPHATVGLAYGSDIQFFVPADTIYLTQTVPITNFTLTNITGLPPGFSYTSNPTTGVFPGNAASCLHISCASPAAAGTWPLTVYVTAHVTYLLFQIAIPDTIRGYKIVIDSAGTGIPVISSSTNFEVYQNMPNPVNGVSEIDYYTPASTKVTFKVVNMLGSLVQNKVLEAKTGMNQVYISSKDIAPGIYMYSISNGTQTITKRMVVGNK